jgi:hypothetical protein
MIGPHRCAYVERGNSKNAKVAPIQAVLQKAERVCSNEEDCESSIVHSSGLQSAISVLFDCQTCRALLEDVQSEAIVCEAFGRVHDDISSVLQVYIVCVRSVSIDIWTEFVGMEAHRKLPESRVESIVVDIDWHAQVVVCVARPLQIEVDLVDGEDKVCGVDGDENLSAVLDEALGARLGPRVAGADKDAVKDVLYPSRSLRVLARVTGAMEGGRKLPEESETAKQGTVQSCPKTRPCSP